MLTASNLNTEFSGKITNENDLNTRLSTEVTTRATLETEHDALATNVWDAGNSRIATDKVEAESILDGEVGTAELGTAAVTGDKVHGDIKDPVAGTAGLRTLGTGATQAMPGDTGLNSVAHTGDVTGETALTIGAAKVTQSMLKTSTQSQEYDITTNTIHKFALTGGQYCLEQTYKGETSDISANYEWPTTTSYATVAGMHNTSGSNKMGYVIHRYITSSGEVNWLFILRDKNTKKVIGRSICPDHPCFGNGGKPLLVPHPFGDYDESQHEIIVINPSNKEIEQMELETIVEDETKPDKDLLEIIAENYEIDEDSNPAWPTKPVTVGLPKFIKDKTGKKILVDYRFMKEGTMIEPIQKVIPQPDYIKVKKLKKK